MRTYLYSEAGFIEKSQWMPNSWVNVECPDDNDFDFLTQELKVPESFLEDIADADERPRTETEGNWLLTILRIPCLLYTSPSPRDRQKSRMPSSA